MRKIILMLAVVMTVFMSSCNLNNADIETLTAEQLIEQAGEIMQNIQNYDSKMELDIKMNVEDSVFDIKFLSDITAFASPVKMKQATTADYSGVSIAYTTYLEKADDEYIIYIQAFDQWSKISVPPDKINAYLQADIGRAMKDYLSLYKGLKDLGTEQIGDVTARKLELVLSGGELFSLIAGNAEFLQNIGGFELDKMAEPGDFSIAFWIDETNYAPVRMEADITKLMNDIIKAAAYEENADENAGGAVSIDACIVIMEIFDINCAEEFIIPNEAIAARDVINDSSELIG